MAQYHTPLALHFCDLDQPAPEISEFRRHAHARLHQRASGIFSAFSFSVAPDLPVGKYLV